MADQNHSENDQLPPPQTQPQPLSPSVAATPAAPAPRMGAAAPLTEIGPLPTGLSGNEIIIGAVVTLILAAVFWFVGKLITDSLIKQYAEVGAARRAGTAIFIFLALLAACATFGFLGHFWQTLFFILPAGFLVAVLFVVALFSLIAANSSKKNR